MIFRTVLEELHEEPPIAENQPEGAGFLHNDSPENRLCFP